MTAVVETATQVPVTAAVEQAARGRDLGALRQAFLLLTKVRVFGRPREDEKLRVYEYEHGVVREGGGVELTVFRWDEISAATQSVTPHFQNGRYTGTTFAYRFTREDRVSLLVDGTFIDPAHSRRAASVPVNQHRCWAELGSAAIRSVAEAQTDGAKSALTAGERLTFGDIVISLQGVHAEKYGIVPWTRIVEVYTRDGRVYLKLGDKAVPISARPAGRLPNLALLKILVDTFAKHG
jgi:hypothetical protein